MDDEKFNELELINSNETDHTQKQKEIDTYLCDNAKLPLRRQFIMSFGTFMLTAAAGATAGFSAILIPQLQNENKTGRYSTEMVSWVAASASLALIFGNIISGYLMERFGRRLSQVMVSFCFTSGWVIIGFANNVYLVLLGRFITGFSQGWLGPLGPVFVGEICAPVYRGFFLASLSLAIAVGVLLSHSLGTFIHWKHASLLCGLLPLIGGTIIYFGRESPAWLASQNRVDETISTFKWYRGTSPAMKVELDRMLANESIKTKNRSNIRMLKTNIKKPEFWKPLLIMIVFFIMTQFSGVNVVNAYTTEIMRVLLGSDSYAYIGMLSLDLLRCISLTCACIVLKTQGRRPMAMFSGLFTTLSLIALAIYLYLVDGKRMSPLITLGLITVYMIVSNFGVVPLPWNMVGEVFATETRGLGSGISVMTTSLAYFITIKTAPAMFESIGHHGTYLFYGISTLLGTIFLFFYLPETRGKTLLDIEEHFKYGSKIDKAHVTEPSFSNKVPVNFKQG